MDHSIKKLFWENTYIHEQIYEFCNARQNYKQAKQNYEILAQQIDTQMGRDFYLRYEQALNEYIAQEVYAYYLFGLGLRQEVLESLECPLSQLR